MGSIEPVEVEYQAFDVDAPEVANLPTIEVKDWPADPWPKSEPVRIDYDAMEVVPADHFEGRKVGVDPANEKHSDWAVESQWKVEDGVAKCVSVEARPAPKTPFVADVAEGFDPSLDVTAFANRHIQIGAPWGTDAMTVFKGKIQSTPSPEEPVAAPVIVEK